LFSNLYEDEALGPKMHRARSVVLLAVKPNFFFAALEFALRRFHRILLIAAATEVSARTFHGEDGVRY
jgi:hypothetical protein